MKAVSINSPKNRYLAKITYGKALKGIGSCSSAHGMTIKELQKRLEHYINMANRNSTKCTVRYFENKATYPAFDWVEFSI